VRLYAAHKHTGDPFPTFSDDDVLDFLVKEAIVFRGLAEEAERAKEREKEDWKGQHKNPEWRRRAPGASRHSL
jgi:hypothetical protein